MNVVKRLLLAAAGLVWFTAVPPLAAAAGDAAATIRGGTEAWVKAYNAGNADAVVALYAEDAVVMPPGAPLVRGHAALRQFFVKDIAGAQAAGVAFGFGAVNEVGVSGDLAWHSGTYVVKDKSGATVDTGKYLETWRKSGGKWRIIRDMWNSDGPAPAAAPAAAPKK